MERETTGAGLLRDGQTIGQAVCRMGRWCASELEASEMLGRLFEKGWSGTMRECGGIWHVDVVRAKSSD